MKRLLKHGLNHFHLSVRRPARVAWRQGLGHAVAVAVLAGTAGAQTTTQAAPQGSQATQGSMQTQSPFWGGQPSGQHPGAQPGYRGGYDRDDFGDAFPVGLVGDVPPAHASYTALKWGHRTTQSAVWQRATELRKGFETSEEYRRLQRDIDEALAALEQARREAYAPLREDPEYAAAGRLYRSLERRIHETHRQQGGDAGEIAAMSEQAMEYAQRQRDMELALAADDSAIIEARERLQALAERQSELEAQFERSVGDDEELRQLRAQASQLKVAKLASGAYYRSSVRAANLAADFAYTRQYLQSPWYGQAGYVSPYADPYGYGYGFGGFRPGGFIIAGPGLGGLGPTEVQLGNTFPRMVGLGVPFVGKGAQVNPGPTIPPDAFE